MTHMNHSKWLPADRILIGLITVVVIAVLGLFIALSFFNYPSADDFCFAAKAKQLGLIGAQAFWYEQWSGRYTLNLVWTVFMLSGDIFKTYRFPAMVLLLSTWLGMSFLIARVIQGYFSTAFIMLLGGVGTVLFIAGTPDPAQTFYWLGGSFTYQIPNILLTFLLGLLIWRETTAKDNYLQILIFILSSILTIIIIGANEVSLLLTDIILCSGVCYALWNKRDSRAFWLILLIIAISSTLVSIFAPGNYQRYVGLAYDSQLRPAPWLSLLLYLPWVFLRLLYWLSNLGLWASALILLIITSSVVKTRLYHSGQFKRLWLMVPVLWIVTIFTLNAIGFLINQYPLPERAESVVWLLFLLGWYPSFIILAHYLIGDNVQFNYHRLIQSATILLIVNLLGTPNVFEAYKDVYRGYRYDQEMRERVGAIQAAKNRGETDIIVSSLSRPPRTLFATDLTTDPKNARNQCLSEYYEVTSITLGSSEQR